MCGALGSGELSLPGCFELGDDPAVGAIHVGDLLEALPSVRKVDARRALAAVGIPGDVSLAATPARDRSRVLQIAEDLSS